jgi:hypothetical protein
VGDTPEKRFALFRLPAFAAAKRRPGFWRARLRRARRLSDTPARKRNALSRGHIARQPPRTPQACAGVKGNKNLEDFYCLPISPGLPISTGRRREAAAGLRTILTDFTLPRQKYI